MQTGTIVPKPGLPDWPFLAKFKKFGLVSSWLAYKILLGLLAFFGFITRWLALKNLFGLLHLFLSFLR